MRIGRAAPPSPTMARRAPYNPSEADNSQKNPRVHKIFVRNSGAGNGCVNFMDAWKNALFLQEKAMSIKFLVLGGGILGFGGGGECRFYFYGRADFSEIGLGRAPTSPP